MALNAQGVDPRDTRWEVDRPSYRVYFWEPGLSDEWQLTDADDVREVMAWAEANANGRQFVVYVAAEDRDQPGLIRLFGVEPD